MHGSASHQHVTGQGTVTTGYSDRFQVFRGQCHNNHLTIQLYNVYIKTTELLKAFVQDFRDVKNHAEIAHTIRTYSSQLKQQNDSGQNIPDLIKPFNKT